MPLIVSAPGRKGRGKASKALVELVDLYPTVCDLTGVASPSHCEGQSFVPVLDNPGRKWKSAAFTQVYNPGSKTEGRAVRTDRYRYIRWSSQEKTGPDTKEEELYDHQTDPREFTNLARQPEKNDRALTQMRATLDAGWQKAKAAV